MWLNFFIVITSIILNIAGTFFLAKATYKNTADIKDLNMTCWDGTNPNMNRIFKRDNKNTITGLSLLIPGILLQVSFTLIEIFKKG